ncbi:MAG: anaerobic ribonucleoside-triphosphate reductase activating protein [Alphaproteobacteria bacterium]|nr:anaerobic ribonucleoside-triphosphate reductase activating protein [Alphaproteobacteria bacterium]
MCINIAAILRFSLLDYPDKISAVLFTQGCPLRCVYCHNPDFQSTNVVNNISFDNVIQFLNTRIELLEGVVFSGGEPLLQTNLYDAMKIVKDMGFLIGLHTSGVIYNNFIKVLPLVNWVGFDVKQIFNKYSDITQINNSEIQVMKSLDALINSNVKYEIRTTVDTRYISQKDMVNIAKYLNSNNVKEWTLQKCILRSKEENINVPFLSDDNISELAQYININVR